MTIMFMPEFWLCLVKVLFSSVLIIAPYMVVLCVITAIMVVVAEWIAKRLCQS